MNFVPRQRKGFTGSQFVQPEILFYPERMYLGYYAHVGFWPGDEDERTRFELEVEAFRNLLVLNLLAGVLIVQFSLVISGEFYNRMNIRVLEVS